MTIIVSPGISITVTDVCTWPITSIIDYRDDYKDGGRFVFCCPKDDRSMIIEWCVENFGPKHRKRWGYSKSGSIYISDKELAMAFKLRWVE